MQDTPVGGRSATHRRNSTRAASRHDPRARSRADVEAALPDISPRSTKSARGSEARRLATALAFYGELHTRGPCHSCFGDEKRYVGVRGTSCRASHALRSPLGGLGRRPDRRGCARLDAVMASIGRARKHMGRGFTEHHGGYHCDTKRCTPITQTCAPRAAPGCSLRPSWAATWVSASVGLDQLLVRGERVAARLPDAAQESDCCSARSCRPRLVVRLSDDPLDLDSRRSRRPAARGLCSFPQIGQRTR